ncbi:hypothetical protein [Kitasatospora sp. NBC_01266]|uniref:hypothetical protein n=1 Tax=Kitasatospora sp. NBC_01266 TaxID=2903572 RepID=UPI002E32B55E|nr:hypothetical protein [Kitasatospora sp. NBC_01266]
MTAARPVRRLCRVEAEQAWAHLLAEGTGQVTTRFTVLAAFGAQYLDRVVARWARRFPALSLRIGEQDDGLWFRRPDGEPPGRAGQQELGPGRTPEQLLAEEAGTVLPPCGPLWRLRIVHARRDCVTHFYLTCHPAICDTYTVGRLVRALLDLLFGEEPEHPGPPHRFTEQLMPDQDELTYRAPAVSAMPAAPWPGTPAPAPSGAGVVAQAGALGDRLWQLSLSPRQHAGLKSWCGSRRITLDQLFAALLATGLARAAGHDRVEVLTALSLRRRYAESTRLSDIGCCVATLRTELCAGGGSPADLARAYAARVTAADAAWRPERLGHAGTRATVTDQAAGAVGTTARFASEGSADTVLGGHARRVTEFLSAARPGPDVAASLQLSVFQGQLRMLVSCGRAAAQRRAAEAVRAELAGALPYTLANSPNSCPTPWPA